MTHISTEDDGIRLDRWFKRHLPNVTHSLLQKAARKGQVRLDGKKVETSTRIVAGQDLQFPNDWGVMEPAKPVPAEARRQAVPADAIRDLEKAILYEDDEIIVINKPAGLAVQGGTGQSKSVDSILAGRAIARKEGRPRLVHRLDRDTSGVLLMGKTHQAAADLAGAFARKLAEKYYWALVLGVPDIPAGTIDLPIMKKADGKDSRMEKVQADDEGKKAITRYRIIESAARRLSWVELLPVTGRTHQLRVHMAEIGHPILGDGKYGGSEAFLDGGEVPKKLHLHARRLSLPFRGKTLEFEAPLTGHMKTSWKLFEFSERRTRD